MSRAEALELLRANRPRAAAEVLQAVIRSGSSAASDWFLLGACLHAAGNLSAAADAFAQGLTRDPHNTEAHVGYITVLRASGNTRCALDASCRALDHLPGKPRLLYAAALCLEDAGKTEEALARYAEALEILPSFEDALHNRALLLARLGRFDDGRVEQERFIAAYGGSARLHLSLCDTLLALGTGEQALEVLDAYDNLQPGDARASIRRGVALALLGRFSDARNVMVAARARDASAVEAYLAQVTPSPDTNAMLCPENIYLWHAWTQLGRCDWTSWDDFGHEIRRAASAPEVALEPAIAFMCRLLPLEGVERLAVVRSVSTRLESRYPSLPPPPPRLPRAQLRIGVLSPDFREHLNGYLLRPLFELADRDRFELFAYSLTPNDGSPIRASLRKGADAFRDLERLSELDAARTIREDDVDILLDVGGHTTGARFAVTAQRPARLHVNYLGFSCTLASPRVDYAIVDRVVGNDPSEWVEARVFLPHTHFLYDFRAPAMELEVSRKQYGLPEQAFVFCAFHRAEKISPDVFDLWMRIVAQVPDSVLWFRALSEAAARNLHTQADMRGVDPRRLVFAPFESSHDPRYLARHRLGDLMLDALYHNATTTACDALGAGLPLLTLQGSAMAARTAESLVRAAGLPELVAQNQDDYVRQAVHLAREPARLQDLKVRLRANRRTAPLFDTAGRVRDLERAFEAMYERMMRGERPTSFDV